MFVRTRMVSSADEGATLVFAAVVMVGLLALTAFAIDFGSIWEERRQLQNGADAAALAIAEDCARGACPADVYATAETYVDGNARDNAAWAYQVDLDLGAQQVTVYNATEDPNGDHLHDLYFSGVVGFDDFTVGADATVVWGSAAFVNTIPIIISDCEWNKDGPGWPDGADPGGPDLPSDPPDYQADTPVTITFHEIAGDCQAGPGHDVTEDYDGDGRLPGGFGWLNTENGTCQTPISGMNLNADPPEYGWAPSKPGNSGDCKKSELELLLTPGNTVFIPFFDDYWANGAGAPPKPPECDYGGTSIPNGARCYHIAGFGAFHITGYRFPGLKDYINPPETGYPCSGSTTCLRGYFVSKVYTGPAPLGGDDRGVMVIRFSG